MIAVLNYMHIIDNNTTTVHGIDERLQRSHWLTITLPVKTAEKKTSNQQTNSSVSSLTIEQIPDFIHVDLKIRHLLTHYKQSTK